MTGHQPLVALIHATPAAIAPATAAFEESFPGARRRNLLDDTLIGDAERAGGLTPVLRERMRTLISYAVDAGADAVLLSCSIYGPVAQEAAAGHDVPVLAADRALFDETARSGATRVAVLGPIEAGTRDTVERLQARLGGGVTVTGATVTGAREALARGDDTSAGDLVAAAARAAEAGGAQVVVLGQFSLAPTLEAARAAVAVPVLSSSHLAAAALRAAVTDSDVPA